MDIHQFRDFVNTYHSAFIYHHFSDFNGKNYWSCLCSAMDWISEAEDALPEFQKRAKGKDAGWFDIYGYISCIDVILEATEQLYRCVFELGGKSGKLSLPTTTKNIFTKPEGFCGLPDRKYFKELRAGFGAHPVNLNDSKTPIIDEHKAKRFASWVLSSERGQIMKDCDFSIRLYSNVKGVKDRRLGVKLSELTSFCDQYRIQREIIVVEMKRQYRLFAEECRKRPIERSADILVQWTILMREADHRCLGSWDAEVIDIFSVTPQNPDNLKLLLSYQKAIRLLMNKMTDAFQKMNDRSIRILCDKFHRVLHPPYPMEGRISYSLGKLFTDELPYSILKSGIEAYFKKQIDFPSIHGNVERRVLVLAALFSLSNKRTSR